MTNPLSYGDLGVALASRGWKASILDDRDFCTLFPKEKLVDVDPAGFLKCVDGRGSDAVGKQQHGPKMLGGVYGIAVNRGIKTTKELEAICQEVKAAGHVPTVHGDERYPRLRVGKLWMNGNSPTRVASPPPPPTSPPTRAPPASRLRAASSRTTPPSTPRIRGQLRPGKTFVPNGKDQRFMSIKALGKFNLDITKYALTAAATVEKLNLHSLPLEGDIVTPPAASARRVSARSRAAAGPRSPGPVQERLPARRSPQRLPQGRRSRLDAKGDQSGLPQPLPPGHRRQPLHQDHQGLEAIREVGPPATFRPFTATRASSLGFCKLWLNDKLADEGMVNESKPKFSAEDGSKTVEKAGGVVENHVGKHTEKVVLNFIDGMTSSPTPTTSASSSTWRPASSTSTSQVLRHRRRHRREAQPRSGRSWKAVLIVPDDHPDAPAQQCCTIQ